jgi:hypothetical protein
VLNTHVILLCDQRLIGIVLADARAQQQDGSFNMFFQHPAPDVPPVLPVAVVFLMVSPLQALAHAHEGTFWQELLVHTVYVSHMNVEAVP